MSSVNVTIATRQNSGDGVIYKSNNVFPATCKNNDYPSQRMIKLAPMFFSKKKKYLVKSGGVQQDLSVAVRNNNSHLAKPRAHFKGFFKDC